MNWIPGKHMNRIKCCHFRTKHCSCLKFAEKINPIHTGLFSWCSTRGGGAVFDLHPVTPLSFKSDDSNFVQSYFGIGSIFLGKKNRDQIDNDVIFALMSIENCSKQPILKSLLLLYVSFTLIETWQVSLTLILLYSQKVKFNIIDVSWFWWRNQHNVSFSGK